uniref:hypothetical protein n=1 Tax=Herbidospora sakaeratensis TaxID=564415 RepID=UPI0007852AD9|nr:hypothetical protein [Herbidospora sakaeratensis]
MELLIIAVVVAIVVGLMAGGGRLRRRRDAADPEFDIVAWHGRGRPSGDGFANATTWVKRDAICHLTGRTAADCACDRHRAIT